MMLTMIFQLGSRGSASKRHNKSSTTAQGQPCRLHATNCSQDHGQTDSLIAWLAAVITPFVKCLLIICYISSVEHIGFNTVLRVHIGLCKLTSKPCWNILISWLWSTVSSAWEWVLCTDQSHFLVVTLEWSELMGSYNTADTVVRDRQQK